MLTPATQGEGPGGASSHPASGNERIDLLDALRGFALLGIFLANLGYFSGWIYLGTEQKEALGALGGGSVRDFFHRAFIEGKFYTVFSLLFGIGFALQKNRLERRGGAVGFRRLYLRRLSLLLAIGLVHLCLIWEGDILTVYALCGFVLLALRDWSSQKLLRLGVALIALPIPIYALFWLAGWSSPGASLVDLGTRVWQSLVGAPVGDADSLEQMQRGGWDGFYDWALPGVFFRWGALLDSHRLPKVLGTFLIGVCAGRAISCGGLVGDIKLLQRICFWGFAVGLPANLWLAFVGGLPYLELSASGFLATFLYAIGVAPLGLAYASSFALLWHRAPRGLLAFSPAGKMALTNYLSQTVFGIAIFYGVGLGLAGRLRPAVWMGLGVGIFALQVFASKLWLNHFRFGPAEWAWRSATYGRLFRLRRDPRVEELKRPGPTE